MNIADDVERPALGAAVDPQGMARDFGSIELGRVAQHPHAAKALSL